MIDYELMNEFLMRKSLKNQQRIRLNAEQLDFVNTCAAELHKDYVNIIKHKKILANLEKRYDETIKTMWQYLSDEYNIDFIQGKNSYLDLETDEIVFTDNYNEILKKLNNSITGE